MKGLMMTAAVAAMTMTGFGAIRAVTPDPYGGKPDAWQMKRHATFMGSVTNGGEKIVFIGDSITHFWEGKPAWEKYFSKGKYKALNLGISADRTEHVLWRLTEGKELDGYEAKVIFLMIGTNNTGHHPFEKEPPTDTVLGIKEILRVIAEKQPKARVILSSIFPRGATPEDGYRKRNDVVNKEIWKFADGKKVIWCDFSDKFLDGAGNLSPELFPDLLHPNALGYEIWASSVIPLFDRCLAAAEDEFIPSVWPSTPYNYAKGGSYAARPTSAYGLIAWWNTRLLEKRNEIADGPKEYDLVMIGDSITHRWEREGGEGRELFAEIKKQYKVLNLGIGGDQTQHVLWRLENGELYGYKAKLFEVMIGTNNGGRDVPGIALGVKRILDDVRRTHPEAKIILHPIFPHGAKPGEGARVYNEKVNALIKPFADGENVIWVDFNGDFLTKDGILTKEVMNDLLHPNEKGYQIWWNAMKPWYEKYCK